MKLPRSCIVLFVVCLAFIIPGVVSAGPQTLLLVSGGNTQSAGYNSTLPSHPLDISSYSNGVWSSAVAVAPISWTWNDPATAPFGSGATWVSSAATTEDGQDNSWRLFKIDFAIPAGSTINSAQLWYTADNAVTVYLNDAEISNTGTVYGAAPTPYPYDNSLYFFLHPYSVNFNPIVGSNTLKFVVRNWDNEGQYNPTGLLYKGIIAYQTPDAVPEFPSAFLPVTMIIGFLGAVLLIQRTREQ